MHNLMLYCLDVGLGRFGTFKLERKSKFVMKEHFVSKKDVQKYNLYLYVQIDKYGRYKLQKYVLRKLTDIISIYKYRNIINNHIEVLFNEIDFNIKKDPLKNRTNKIINIQKIIKEK